MYLIKSHKILSERQCFVECSVWQLSTKATCFALKLVFKRLKENRSQRRSCQQKKLRMSPN